jgi:preprotein translocase subunit YajC
MFVSIANAMAPTPGGAAGGAAGGTMSFLVTIVLMFGIFYFLLIRPQQKRAKQQKNMLDALNKGDYVITSSGLLGRIIEADNNILTVDLGDTKVKVLRNHIAGTYDPKDLQKAAADSGNEGK